MIDNPSDEIILADRTCTDVSRTLTVITQIVAVVIAHTDNEIHKADLFHLATRCGRVRIMYGLHFRMTDGLFNQNLNTANAFVKIKVLDSRR